MADSLILRSWCRACQRPTNHTLLWRTEASVTSDESREVLLEEFAGVQCRGCDTISLRYRTAVAEPGETFADQDAVEETLYPSTGVVGTAHAADFPGIVGKMYGEVMIAMRSGLGVLSGVGLRALIEAICRERDVAGRDLARRIDGLVSEGLISPAQAEHLHSLRFLGNVAAHEMTAAPIEELRAALEIAEALLRNIYVLPKRALSIKTGAKRVAEPSPESYSTTARPKDKAAPPVRVLKGTRTSHAEFAAPLIQVLEEAGGSLPADAAINRVGEIMAHRLTETDKERLPKGEIRWRNTVRWTRNWLVEQGRIDKSVHGVWRLAK